MAGVIVSRKKLAEFLGVHVTTVDNWVSAGCPYKTKGRKGVEWQFNSSDVVKWREDRVKNNEEEGEPETLKSLQLRLMRAQAEKVELDLAKARDEVAPIEEVAQAWESVFAMIKSRLRNVPKRCSTQLAGETDTTRIKQIIGSEIDEALTEFADTPLNEEDIFNEAEVA